MLGFSSSVQQPVGLQSAPLQKLAFSTHGVGCHGSDTRESSAHMAFVVLGLRSRHSSGFCSQHFKKSHNYTQRKLHWRFIESTRADDSSLRKIRFLGEIFVIRDGFDKMMVFTFHWQGPLLSSVCSVTELGSLFL